MMRQLARTMTAHNPLNSPFIVKLLAFCTSLSHLKLLPPLTHRNPKHFFKRGGRPPHYFREPKRSFYPFRVT
jgi:hypothetical protein